MTPRDRAVTGLSETRLSRSDGFTLVEVLVAMLAMLLVLAAVYGIWFGLQRTYDFTDEDTKAQEEARTALNEMVELIRTARQPRDADAAVLTDASEEDLDMVIVYADDNELVFWSDVDRDEAHDLELVRFRVEESERTLYRDVSQTGDPTFTSESSSVRLVGKWLSNGSSSGGSSPLFQYRKSSDQPPLETPLSVADLNNMRQITINLNIDVETEKSPIRHSLSSVVQPRNLRSF